MERRSLKRQLPSLTKTCVKSGPFAPRPLRRFLATMSRSDSRPRSTYRYGFRHVVGRVVTTTTPGLPGPSTTLSTRVLPNRPGRLDGCVCSLLPHRWQASAPPQDWPPSSGLTRPNRVRVRWTHVFAVRPLQRSTPGCPRAPGLGPFRVIGCPCTPDRCYMLNEQFTWLTPFSQQESPGLAWRDRSNGDKTEQSIRRGAAKRRRRPVKHERTSRSGKADGSCARL